MSVQGELYPDLKPSFSRDNASAFFRYPGGKRKLVRQILSRLRTRFRDKQQAEYCEPFCGGASIAIAFARKSGSMKLILNDSDPGIASLWLAVSYEPEALKKMVLKYNPSPDDFYKFQKKLMKARFDEHFVATGFMKLVIHQISYSGLGVRAAGPIGGKDQTDAEYKVGCRWNADRLCLQIDRLNAALSYAEIHCGDFEPFLIPNRLLYLDPPYYRKGNDLYRDKFSEADHARLADALKALDSQTWILSYDECPEVRALYAWANIEKVTIKYSITAPMNTREATKEKDIDEKYELIISPPR
jgi:DNA adenine methylase